MGRLPACLPGQAEDRRKGYYYHPSCHPGSAILRLTCGGGFYQEKNSTVTGEDAIGNPTQAVAQGLPAKLLGMRRRAGMGTQGSGYYPYWLPVPLCCCLLGLRWWVGRGHG